MRCDRKRFDNRWDAFSRVFVRRAETPAQPAGVFMGNVVIQRFAFASGPACRGMKHGVASKEIDVRRLKDAPGGARERGVIADGHFCPKRLRARKLSGSPHDGAVAGKRAAFRRSHGLDPLETACRSGKPGAGSSDSPWPARVRDPEERWDLRRPAGGGTGSAPWRACAGKCPPRIGHRSRERCLAAGRTQPHPARRGSRGCADHLSHRSVPPAGPAGKDPPAGRKRRAVPCAHPAHRDRPARRSEPRLGTDDGPARRHSS